MPGKPLSTVRVGLLIDIANEYLEKEESRIKRAVVIDFVTNILEIKNCYAGVVYQPNQMTLVKDINGNVKSMGRVDADDTRVRFIIDPRIADAYEKQKAKEL